MTPLESKTLPIASDVQEEVSERGLEPFEVVWTVNQGSNQQFIDMRRLDNIFDI